jgi:outer membrane immunogenic protein
MKSMLIMLAVATTAAPALAQDWSGLYGGAALSYDAVELNDLSYGDGPVDLNGAGLGLFAGYNFQSGNFVYGAELSLTKHSGEGFDGDYLEPATALSSMALRGRVGFVTGNMLPYLALGAYRTKFEADHDGSGDPADIWDETASGTGLALGVDWTLSDSSFLRVEIETIRYKDDSIGFYDGSDPHDYELDARRLTVGYAMRF